MTPQSPDQANSTRAGVGVVSDMCVDLIVRGNVRPRFGQFEQLVDGYELEIGGSANIFACQLAKLGVPALVIGRVGDDEFGDFARRRLSEEGIDASAVVVDPAVRTGLGVALVETDDRAILTFLGSINAVSPEDLGDYPERLCRHWHVASYFLLRRMRPAWPDFLARARSTGVTTSLDPNWDPDERWDGIPELLPHLDIFFPNEAELRAIAGDSDLERAARRVSEQGPIVVVKRGAEGPMAVSRDSVVIMSTPPAETPAEIVDSVGAGDNFDAGFLSAWLAGATLDDCLARGHRCAAASLRAAGGIKGQLNERELSAHSPEVS